MARTRITNVLTGEILPPPKTQNALVPPPPPDPPAESDWGGDGPRREGPQDRGLRDILGKAQPLLSHEFVEEFLHREEPKAEYLGWHEDIHQMVIFTVNPVSDNGQKKLRDLAWDGRPVIFRLCPRSQFLQSLRY